MNLINIDGTIINMDKVIAVKWHENRGLCIYDTTLDTPHYAWLGASKNARRAYDYLCSRVPNEATFTDDTSDE